MNLYNDSKGIYGMEKAKIDYLNKDFQKLEDSRQADILNMAKKLLKIQRTDRENVLTALPVESEKQDNL
jgi:hypothetical protein